MYAEFMGALREFVIDSGIATEDTVRGCTDSEIADLERRLSVRLPLALAECLRCIGHDCGSLFDGDAFGLDAFDEAREVAVQITSEPGSPWQLPDDAIPFLQHHGYEFLYVHASASDDPPVWLYIETEPKPEEWGLSFSVWLRESAIWCVEGKPWQFQSIWCQEFPATDLYRRLLAEGKRIPWGWLDPRDA